MARDRRRERGHSREVHSESTRSHDGIPHVYRELLSEASCTSGYASDTGETRDEARSVKRRRVGERSVSSQSPAAVVAPVEDGDGLEAVAVESRIEKGKPLQTAYDLDVSDDSDMEWENVEFSSNAFMAAAGGVQSSETPSYAEGFLSSPAPASRPEETETGDDALRITLENHDGRKAKQRATSQRRKPVTGLEKKWRLDIHKMHLLCLLGHVHMRNLWCNDDEVQVNYDYLVILSLGYICTYVKRFIITCWQFLMDF